jgi:hypothetical protein
VLFRSAIAAAVWGYATRTLTQSAAAGGDGAVAGTTITRIRGDTLLASLTGLGNISARSKLWFTVKSSPEGDADTDALLLIEETAGLTVVNKAPYLTIAHGSIVVTNATTGALTVTVKPEVTRLLAAGSYHYDVQMLTGAAAVITLIKAIFVIDAMTDVTRAIA